MIEVKHCSHCKRLLPLSEFRFQKCTGYYQSWCWDCEKEQKRPQLIVFREEQQKSKKELQTTRKSQREKMRAKQEAEKKRQKEVAENNPIACANCRGIFGAKYLNRVRGLCYHCEKEYQRSRMRRYAVSPKGKETRQRYANTPIGRAIILTTKRRYNHSAKNRLAQKRYLSQPGKKELAIVYSQSEKAKAYRRTYYQSLRGKLSHARTVAKRTAAMAIESTLTDQEWNGILRANRGRCYWCKKSSPKLHRDHVIPLCRGGGHTKENVVPACPICNLKKNKYLWSLV